MMVPPIKEQEEIVKRLATRNVVKVKKKKKKKGLYGERISAVCHGRVPPRCAGHE
jgi:uncharacterized protein with ACT and thioredoxin-like domain